MKIAIISFYMMETTIPLAKELSLSDDKIHLYSLLPYGDQNTFVFDFLKNKQKNGFVNHEVLKQSLVKRLYLYLSNINTSVFIFPDRWFQKFFLLDLYYAYKFAQVIKRNHYDIIHIIHSSRRFWLFFYVFIEKMKIVQTLHEVTAREEKSSILDSLKLKLLIRDSIPIIFHSNISKSRFIKFREISCKSKAFPDNLKIIRFGLFETYKCFSSGHNKFTKREKIIILGFGRIVQSKGFPYLIDAIRLLQDHYAIHLIIAGYGAPNFNFSNIRSYDFINRFVSNVEIVKLIESCDMVVLPYISASQSGALMTAFSFNKPVIASNVGAFKELIDHGVTGLLVDELNSESLSKSIETLLKDERLRLEMKNSIHKKYCEGEFSWKDIAKDTLQVYRSRRQEQILEN